MQSHNMPSTYMYFKYRNKSNKVAWYGVICVAATVLIGLLYSAFLGDADAFYDEDYYRKISDITIPESRRVLESYDNGEFWTSSSFRLDKESIKEFVSKNNFQLLNSGEHVPAFLSESMFKVEKPDTANKNYLYNSGAKGKNSWLYIIDTSKGILWAEIQYPDWGGT